ncbi:MAG: PQQ-binding-like beta-propeller repeat protein, partial [Elusimicrobia bacterium]|nr:PQQ-binding-like beta-propeller repeat protein [Elusimicrobiota bacterium]
MMRPLARLSAALVVALLAAPQAAAEPKVLGTHPLSSAPYGLSSPQFAAVDSVRHEVWVAGYYSANVVVVDGASRQPVAAIPGIQYPVAVAVDGGRSRAYVATYNSLLVFDTVSRKKLFSYPLYTPGQAYFQPFAMALDEANGHVYLYGARTVYSGQTSSSTMRLAEYDPVTGAMVAGIDLPDYHYSSKLAVSGAKIFLPVNIHDQEKMTYRSELWVIDKALPAVSQKIATTSQYTHSMTLHPGNGAVYLYDGGKLVSYAPGASGQWVKASSGPAGGFLWDMALDPVTNLIYGLDRYNDLVRIIDPKTLKETGTLPAGAEPAIVVMDSALGKSFVFNSKSNNAVVYDLATGTLAGWVDLRRCEPRGLAVDPGSWRTLAACGMTGSVAFWNKASHAVDKTVTVPYGQPSGLAIFPGLNKAYIKVNPAPYGYLERLSLSASELAPRIGNRYTVTGLAAYPEATALLLSEYFLPGGTSTTAVLTMVDAQSDLVSKSIPLGPSYHYPLAPVVNAATAKAYVVLYATHQVVAVDLGSGAVLKRIPVGNYPMAAAVNPNLNRVYVANYGSNSLSMIDGATDAVLGTVAVGPAPKAVAVKKRGARVYVANSGDGTVTVLDGKTLAKIATLPSGNLPSDIAVDETAEQALVANESDASITVIEDPAPVDGAAPAVNHTPLTGPFPEYSPVTVEAQVTDDKAVAVVTLTYWEPGAGTYYTVAMANVGGSLYRGVIPAEFLFSLSKGGKVQYFIDASDAEGNGPPTGQTPGSAGQPNEFSVLKAFSPLWTYTFGGFFGGAYRMVPGPSAAIGDIRPDIGGLEVATGNEEYWPFGFNGPSGRWFLFTSTGGVAFWKNTENDEAHSSVNLFDLDGDGALEMLGGTTSGRELQAWDRFGGWLWRFLLDGHHLSTPAVDVLKPGEAPTVFGGSFDSRFRAIHGKAGTLRWSYPVSTGTWIWSSPAVGDLDGDGAKEVVFGSDQMTAGTPNLFSLDAHTGALRWSAVLGGHVRASAAIADLDADGVLEVLIGAPDGIFRAFHGKTGQVLWSYKTGGEIISSAAVGDVDGDGKPEVLFGSGDGKLYCLDRLGALRWATPLGSPVLGSPALARRTPGPGLAVYIAANSGLLHVLAGADGKKLAGLALNAPVASSPVVGDIDGDGKLEVLFQDRRGDTLDTKTGDVFWAIRDTGSQVPVYAREWPLFRRDPAHTGVYPWQSAPPPPPPPPPDTAAPVSVITSPAGGLVFATTTVSILGTASDDDSGIAKVELGLADL